MDELGMCDRETPLAPVDDERWNSVIGKELWEVLMRDMFRDADNVLRSSEDDSTPC
jgi:hypothetical protein